MDVDTILVSKDEAQQKLDEYQSVNAKVRQEEDAKLKALYKAVANGARVMNLSAAFTKTGLNELLQPRLAVARADWKLVYCFSRPTKLDGSYNSGINTVGFSDREQWEMSASRKNILLPDNTFSVSPDWPNKYRGLRSPVPHIPPKHRPVNSGLHNYHILFEVERWEEYPADPYLLRRIQGMLFVVWAEWELTELERSLLASIASGT